MKTNGLKNCGGWKILCPERCKGCSRSFEEGHLSALNKIKDMIKKRYTELEILEYISKEELK